MVEKDLKVIMSDIFVWWWGICDEVIYMEKGTMWVMLCGWRREARGIGNAELTPSIFLCCGRMKNLVLQAKFGEVWFSEYLMEAIMWWDVTNIVPKVLFDQYWYFSTFYLVIEIN